MYLLLKKPEDLRDAALTLKLGHDDHLMVLVAEASASLLPAALAILVGEGVSHFGAVFPGLIDGRERRDSGAIVRKVRLAGSPCLVDLSPDPLPTTALAPVPQGTSLAHGQTLCVFVDCLATHINILLRDLFHRYGNTVQYFGAGAGNSQLQRRPTVFCNGRFEADRAVVALVAQPARVAGGHGWTRAEGPFIATRTENNTIRELNWEPALRVYERYLHDRGETLSPENFYGTASGHPFGIDKEGAEDVVRDPIGMTSDGGLICISHVPEHSVLHILQGDSDQLVAAAASVVKDCGAALNGPPENILVCDCFSRVLRLSDAFTQELEAVAAAADTLSPGLRVEGVLALGEIASDGLRLPEFFNKTFVVGLWTA